MTAHQEAGTATPLLERLEAEARLWTPSPLTNLLNEAITDLTAAREALEAKERECPADDQIAEVGRRCGLWRLAYLLDADQWNNIEPLLFKFARAMVHPATCDCTETYPQMVAGRVSHGPGCVHARPAAPSPDGKEARHPSMFRCAVHGGFGFVRDCEMCNPVPTPPSEKEREIGNDIIGWHKVPPVAPVGEKERERLLSPEKVGELWKLAMRHTADNFLGYIHEGFTPPQGGLTLPDRFAILIQQEASLRQADAPVGWKPESRWLIERTYAKGQPAERREFWLGMPTSSSESWTSDNTVWTTDALAAARFSSEKIARTLRLYYFHPEAPVEACEHMFGCGTSPATPRPAGSAE